MANIIITFSIMISISSFACGGLLGGRTKVADVKTNKEIQAMGRFSVEEYNRQLRRSRLGNDDDDGELTFSRVVEAEQQVVAGMKYYLKIETFWKSGGDPQVFQAVVEVKPWHHSKKLLKFAPSRTILR